MPIFYIIWPGGFVPIYLTWLLGVVSYLLLRKTLSSLLDEEAQFLDLILPNIKMVLHSSSLWSMPIIIKVNLIKKFICFIKQALANYLFCHINIPQLCSSSPWLQSGSWSHFQWEGIQFPSLQANWSALQFLDAET